MVNQLTKLDQYLNSTDHKELIHVDSDLIFWIDWREHDDAIIDCVEASLQTGVLSAKINDKPAEELELEVHFEGNTYRKMIVDRDDTLIWLNAILQPKYEIRFCKQSLGSDTLAFIALSNSDWDQLSKQYGAERINELFDTITPQSKFFNTELEFEE